MYLNVSKESSLQKQYHAAYNCMICCHCRRKIVLFVVVLLSTIGLICSSWLLSGASNTVVHSKLTSFLLGNDKERRRRIDAEITAASGDCATEDWLSDESAQSYSFPDQQFSLAFIIFNRETSVNKEHSAVSFVSSACNALLRLNSGNSNAAAVNVTFFVFNLFRERSNTSSVEETDSSCGPIVSISPIISPNENILDPDRCEMLLKYSDAYQYFDSNKFSYVLSFDSTAILTSKVNLQRLFSKELVTFSYKSLIKKWGRWSRGAFIYSSKAFGGRPGVTKKLCEGLTTAKPLHYFQKKFDNYFQLHPPKTTVFLGLQHCKELHYLSNFVFTDRIVIPVDDLEEENYLKYLEVLKETEEARKRQGDSAKIRDEIKRNYFSAVEKQLAKVNETKTLHKFVAATCNFPKTTCFDEFFQGRIPGLVEIHQPPGDKRIFGFPCIFPVHSCNGFGDRLRGTIIALYLAIGTRRIFHVEWKKPSDVADYFQMNEMFYGAEPHLYQKIVPLSANDSIYWLLQRSEIPEKVLMDDMSRKDFIELTENFTIIKTMSNRFAGLEGVLNNPSFQERLRETVPSAFDKNRQVITNYLPVISGAMQAILEKPSRKMAELFELIVDKTIGSEFWQHSTKIGVQVRTEVVESTLGNRVILGQMKCFIGEVERLIASKIRNPFFYGERHPVTVFVTGDWDGAFAAFSDSPLSNQSEVKIFSTDPQFNLSINHMDKDVAEGSDDELWWKFAKGFVDWYILTKMDFLVISRSGFGESAALMSSKPTRRFQHWLSKTGDCVFFDYHEELTTLHMTSDADIYDVL